MSIIRSRLRSLKNSIDSPSTKHGAKFEIASGYFKANVYPGFKDKVAEQVKKKNSSSLSNLWLFTGAKRINELGIGDITSNPVPAKLVDKSRIKEHEPVVCSWGDGEGVY